MFYFEYSLSCSKSAMENTATGFTILIEGDYRNYSSLFKLIVLKKVFALVIGNIGAGKSSVLSHLARNDSYHVIDEPIEKWQNFGGHNLLVEETK